MQTVDVIVIGAGAAGMMCAIHAARRGRRVMVVEHNRAPGEKIRISGGGRCNFTNLDCSAQAYLSQNPKFAISPLKRFSQWDFIDYIATAGIAYHQKTVGQLFCDGSAKQIVALLVRDMAGAGVDLVLGATVQSVARDADGFVVALPAGRVRAQSVVVACGGKSIPKMGASGFGYRVARHFGLPQIETRPALVPLIFAPHVMRDLAPLAGLSVDAAIAAGGARFREGMLFTHRGLSGPSVLQISSYWREGQAITVDMLPGQDAQVWLAGLKRDKGRLAVANAMAERLPKRLAALIARPLPAGKTLATLTAGELATLAGAISNWTLLPSGSEGYRTAEVTLGGVSTEALDARTMQAKSVPGLYFIGEVVDVTGWLGGYNFQWAWSSGWVAGQAA